MTETELDHKTFDLAAVLAGQEFPETEVKVYFDQKLGFTINKLREAIEEAGRRANAAEILEDFSARDAHEATAAELQGELDELVKKVADAEYTVKMRGIPEGTRKAILKTIKKDFPIKRDMFGREEENIEAEEAYTRKMWAAMIVEVVDPKGAVSPMSEELAGILQEKAPAPAQAEIFRGMEELFSGSKSGFEYAAKQVDFLSIASPEG